MVVFPLILDLLIELANIIELAILIKRHKRNSNFVSPTDRTLVSLCVADILVGASGIIFHWRRQIWPGKSNVFRYMHVLIIEFSVISSLLNVGLITIERIICVLKPMAYKVIFTSRLVISIIIAIWILNLTVVPAIVFTSFIVNRQLDNYFIAVLVVACFLLLVTGYTKIYLKLRRSRLRLLRRRDLGSVASETITKLRKENYERNRYRFFHLRDKKPSDLAHELSNKEENRHRKGCDAERMEVSSQRVMDAAVRNQQDATNDEDGKSQQNAILNGLKKIIDKRRTNISKVEMRHGIGGATSDHIESVDKVKDKSRRDIDSLGCTNESMEEYGKQIHGKIGTTLSTADVDPLVDYDIETTDPSYHVTNSQTDLGQTHRSVLEKFQGSNNRSNETETLRGGPVYTITDNNFNYVKILKKREAQATREVSQVKAEEKGNNHEIPFKAAVEEDRKTNFQNQVRAPRKSVTSMPDMQNEMRLRREREFLLLGTSICFAFIVCFVPYAAFTAIFRYSRELAPYFRGLYLLVRTNSLINPAVFLLFAWRSKRRSKIC